ncbi:MAG: hypothetical protein ABIG42_10100 [bacterium]
MRAFRKILPSLLSLLSLLFFLLFVPTGFTGPEKGMTVSGQEGVSIQMAVHVGFEGYFRENIPAPVWIEIFNGSETYLDGELSIDTKKWVPPATYTHEVHVPPGQIRVYQMYIFEGVTTSVDVGLNNSKGRMILKKSVPVIAVNSERGILILNICENPDVFNFLDLITIPGLRRFKNAPLNLQTVIRSDYNLSLITIVSEYPPQLSQNVTAWDALSSVFCDLRSYINLKPDLKIRLMQWVNLGGELLLFPPNDKLTSDEITQLNKDSFLPFRIKAYQNSTGKLKYDLVDPNKLDSVLDIEYESSAIAYNFGEGTHTLITSSASQSGGITLFGFHPDAMNLEKLDVWIEVMFQLGLLTPYPHRYGVYRTIMQLVSGQSGRGSHIPTREERFLKGIMTFGLRLFLTVILPTLIILLVGVQFFRIEKKMLFLYYILPILIIVSVFIPTLAVKKAKIDIRQFEGYHLLQLAKGDLPSALNSYLVISKKFPQSGKIKLNRKEDFSFYDEIISPWTGDHPVLQVDCTPPGTIETSENSPEEYRVMLGISEKTQTGSINGEIKFMPNGSFKYKIRNDTDYKLTNCEFYPYGLHLMPVQLPRMLPDMEPGQILEGKNEELRDDATVDNKDVFIFSNELGKRIFSPETRQELMYSFEARVQDTAYKLNRPWYAYLDEALFFAFTKDYRSGLKINGNDVIGPEVTLIYTRLDVEYPDHFERNKIDDISTLFEDAPNRFEKFRLDEIFPRDK